MIKLHEATETDLPRLLGEILQPDKKKCTCSDAIHIAIWNEVWCPNCGYFPDENTIELTWDNAMKWRDRAVERLGEAAFHQAMWEVCCVLSEHGQNTAYSYWLATKTKPRHYLIAAADCELKEQE